jgi:hypothetical protein
LFDRGKVRRFALPTGLVGLPVTFFVAMLRWADKCAGEAYRYLKLDALNACTIAERETALNGFRKRTREFQLRPFYFRIFLPATRSRTARRNFLRSAGLSASSSQQSRLELGPCLSRRFSRANDAEKYNSDAGAWVRLRSYRPDIGHYPTC